jgi:hypothetical protein
LLHQLYHLGLENTLFLRRKIFKGVGVKGTIQQVVQGCKICQRINPNNRCLQALGTWRQGTYPDKDWQLDSIRMPGEPNSILLLVDTFMGWVETFLCKAKKDREVVKILITESFPDSTFLKVSSVITVLSLKPESSGKVKKVNEILRR